MSVGRERTEDGLPPLAMSDRDAAHLFVHAYETDSMRAWSDATRAWNDRPYVGKIGAAVKALRCAWYHDGTESSRNRVIRAAESLRALLAERLP